MLKPSQAKEFLEKTANILESLGLTYWIDSGTLLSAYRDKDINIFDHDIDFRVYEQDVTDEITPKLVGALWEAGFNWIEATKPIKSQILAAKNREIMLDLKLCYRDEEHVWYYCWAEPDPRPMLHVYPVKFFDLGKIELLGREYPCPQPIEDYITYHYGEDWRKFKVRPQDADKTDLTWDYMKDPPCAMTLLQFWVLKGESPYTPFSDSLKVGRSE